MCPAGTRIMLKNILIALLHASAAPPDDGKRATVGATHQSYSLILSDLLSHCGNLANAPRVSAAAAATAAVTRFAFACTDADPRPLSSQSNRISSIV